MKTSDYFVHEFKVDLAWSESMEQWSFYLLILSRFFPEVEDWSRIRDLLQQKHGKDIILQIRGEEVKIQIKARRIDYGDICLEYRHDHENGTSWDGWIKEDLDLDYLIYCIPSVGKAYLYDWPIIQKLWFKNESQWVAIYPFISASNPTYKTINVGIPPKILESALVQYIDFKNGKVEIPYRVVQARMF